MCIICALGPNHRLNISSEASERASQTRIQSLELCDYHYYYYYWGCWQKMCLCMDACGFWVFFCCIRWPSWVLSRWNIENIIIVVAGQRKNRKIPQTTKPSVLSPVRLEAKFSLSNQNSSNRCWWARCRLHRRLLRFLLAGTFGVEQEKDSDVRTRIITNQFLDSGLCVSSVELLSRFVGLLEVVNARARTVYSNRQAWIAFMRVAWLSSGSLVERRHFFPTPNPSAISASGLFGSSRSEQPLSCLILRAQKCQELESLAVVACYQLIDHAIRTLSYTRAGPLSWVELSWFRLV